MPLESIISRENLDEERGIFQSASGLTQLLTLFLIMVEV